MIIGATGQLGGLIINHLLQNLITGYGRLPYIPCN